MRNTWPFVVALCERMEQNGIVVWLAGGWAEERHGLCAPRPHGDVDLLYPATDFAALDALFAADPTFTAIAAKRFSHKRAALLEDVMIEWLLVVPTSIGFQTHYFDGAVVLSWPADTFADTATAPRLVSTTTLQFYRAQHPRIAQAYTNYSTIVSLVQRP